MQKKILEYRNGIYQGHVKGNKRHGAGILITDEGQIFVGEWKNDQLFGKGLVFISPDEYGFGDFNRGEIQGFFLFRQRQKTFFSEFNISRPINKMMLIDYENEAIQTIGLKNPIFEVLGEKRLSNISESDHLQDVLGVSFPCLGLIDFLEGEMCTEKSCFKIKSLHNGNTLFYFDDSSNPSSLGFALNKNEQLMSYGVFVGDKLTGLGCKFENTIRYEGMFENGFMNGIGLKSSQGKSSFGEFLNGNLTEALFIDDRSNLSEDKLKDFKRAEHIRSLWHCNSYIKKNLMKFKGIRELVFEVNTQQEYLYPQTSLKKNSPVKNLALKMTKRDNLETKSSKSFSIKPFNKNPEEEDALSQSNASYLGLSTLRKFKY